jgi:hypothetical protein
MKLSMHPGFNRVPAGDAVRRREKDPIDNEVIDIMTGAHHREPLLHDAVGMSTFSLSAGPISRFSS